MVQATFVVVAAVSMLIMVRQTTAAVATCYITSLCGSRIVDMDALLNQVREACARRGVKGIEEFSK